MITRYTLRIGVSGDRRIVAAMDHPHPANGFGNSGGCQESSHSAPEDDRWNDEGML
jgi:hypothetical protein